MRVMNRLVTSTAKLLPRANRRNGGLVTAYFYEPEPGVEPGLGSLFAIIEVLGSPKQAPEVVDLIIETIGHQYYNQETEGELDPLAAFERAIKTVNHGLGEYISQGNASWIGKASAVIAVLAEDQLHLTQAGSAEAYLYRKGREIHVSADLHQGQLAQLKTFSNIASGTMLPGDRLLFATPALLHQVAKTELRSIIADNEPASAVAELAQLIGTENSDRIAAVIAEVVTPEQLALKVKNEEPNTAYLGASESPLQAAAATAAPVAKKAAKHGVRLFGAATAITKQKLLPGLRKAGLAVAGKLRKFFSGPDGRNKFLITLAIIGALVAFMIYSNLNGSRMNSLIKQYDSALTTVNQARAQLDSGDKASARVSLTKATSEIATLKKSPFVGRLDKKLGSRPHPETDPASTTELAELVALLQDQLEGLAQVTPNDVVELSTIANSSPGYMEQVGKKLIVIGSKNNPAIAEYDLSNSRLKTTVASSTLGQPVATTVSSSGDGVYILTSEPSVWLYKITDSTVTKQTVSFGEWPKAKDISSYAGNIYLLSAEDGQIYRHVPTSGGFSAKQVYLLPAQVASTAGATSMAVDGSALLGGVKGGLNRYLIGALTQSSTLPDSLQKSNFLRSYADGSTILTIDSTSKRIGIITFDGTNLSFTKQFSLKNVSSPLAAALDTTTRAVYTLTEGKIVKFAL